MKWIRTRWIASLIVLLPLALGTPARPADVVVNPATTWGTWDGWGCSLAWWANVFGARNDMADICFTTKSTVLNGETLPGLGFNIARYNVGACNSAPAGGQYIQLSPNIPAFKQMQGYWLDWNSSDPTSASWNWYVDSNQRNMLWKARDRGANLLELFSNSPMWWMCVNHNPSGATTGSNDNLQTWNNNNHAVYLATVAKYAHDNWAVNFTSVEPFNEPVSTWWNSNGTQEGCHFANATQATLIGDLRTELNNRGLTGVKVSASDDNKYDEATTTWQSFNSNTQSQVGRVNVHGYQYGNGRRDLLHSAVAGKQLWNSEYGEGDGTGLQLVSNLNLDFRWLHNTAWCYWQPFDSGGWGLVQCNPGDNWVGNSNMKYWVLAQYSRHIRPGMTIMDGGDANTIAAYDSTNHKLVLVCVMYNPLNGAGQYLSYSLANFTTVNGPITRWCTNINGGDKYTQHTDTTLSGKRFWSWFAPNTVQTFEIQGVYR